MARRVIPPTTELKFKRQAKVSRTAHVTRTVIDVVADDPTQPTQEGNVKNFLDQALRRFQMAVDAEAYNRLEGLKDVMMVDGDGQWDGDIRGKRMRKKRPCLTINRFIPMLSHVGNEMRMSRPAIQVDPVGGGGDKLDAEIRQGLLRHIEIASHAETIYDTAFERMIEKGWSWLRLVTDWESELSHNQIIKIEGFTNDFCVYSDPSAEDPTRKDMKWAFIVYDMPRGEYISQYPKSKACSMTSFASIGDEAPGWITTDSIRVVEYYYIQQLEAISVRLIGGEGIWEDEIEERAGLWYRKADLAAMDAGKITPEQCPPVPVDLDDDGQLGKRKSFKCRPKWCKINAVEILDGDKGDDYEKNIEGRDIAGKYIPLIMVCGRERTLKGQRRLSGMVRNARDAQRMYNYMTSGFAEMVALAPKSPFIAAIGQIEDFKPIWDALNEENWPYLPYKPKDVMGQLVPAPSRQSMEPPVQAYINGMNQFDNILKISFNIYDPSLGTAKSDQSGNAIKGLQGQSDAANMNWMDNMRRSIVYAGEVALEMIPVVYDSARVITIDRAGKKEDVPINQEFKDPRTGKFKNHDMAVGKFSCTISQGQVASKRQEAVQSLTAIAKNVPQVSLALLPLILSQMDTPMADEAAAIIKRMQPPQLQEPGSPEEVQAQFQELMKQHQLLVKALQSANELIRTKQLDTASKERIAGLQAQAQIAMAAIKAGNAQGMQMGAQEFQRITQALDQDHERILAEQQAAHELRMEQMQQDAPPAGGAPGQPQSQPSPQPVNQPS